MNLVAESESCTSNFIKKWALVSKTLDIITITTIIIIIIRGLKNNNNNNNKQQQQHYMV